MRDAAWQDAVHREPIAAEVVARRIEDDEVHACSWRGTDLILVTGTEATSRGVYIALLADAANGTIPLATLQASYGRILALKAHL